MSYCRNNGDDSNVYMIHSVSGNLECFGAGWALPSDFHEKIMVDTYDSVNGKIVKTGEKHQAEGSFYTKSRFEMIEHLNQHRAAGHKVPEYAFKRLRDEIDKHGDKIGDDDGG